MKFQVKTVTGKELEETLNNYEPYSLTPLSIVPDIFVDMHGRTVTNYKIIYEVVPEEDLREAPKYYTKDALEMQGWDI